MREVVIVDGVRTPIGKAGREKGYYKDVRADDLAVNCVQAACSKKIPSSIPKKSRTSCGDAPIRPASRDSTSAA